jgi:hypothetical protein
MTQSATATVEAIAADGITTTDEIGANASADVVAAATEAAAARNRPADTDSDGTTPAALVPVSVSRALGGPRKRRRSDQRWEVTEADLNMYALITGRPPSEAERVAALTGIPNEETALRDAGAGTGGTAAALGGMASRLLSRTRPDESEERSSWSPAALYACLRDVYYFGAHLTQLRVTRPQVSAWVRHVSTEARRRLQETQARLSAPRGR